MTHTIVKKQNKLLQQHRPISVHDNYYCKTFFLIVLEDACVFAGDYELFGCTEG